MEAAGQLMQGELRGPTRSLGPPDRTGRGGGPFAPQDSGSTSFRLAFWSHSGRPEPDRWVDLAGDISTGIPDQDLIAP